MLAMQHVQTLGVPIANGACLFTANKPAQRRSSSRQNPIWRLCAASSDAEQSGTTGAGPQEPQADEVDWRSFRAALVAAERRQEHEDTSTSAAAAEIAKQDANVWAHPITTPEAGCLLIARRPDMGFFTNSVILLLQHSSKEGSFGLVLGRKMKTREGIQGVFANVLSMTQTMYLGGPVGLDRMLVLHGPPALQDSIEVLKGVFIGGWKEAESMLSKLDPAADSMPHIRAFVGSCGWAQGQLLQEEANGLWWLVAASPQCIDSILHGELDEERDGTPYGQMALRTEIMQLAGIQTQ